MLDDFEGLLSFFTSEELSLLDAFEVLLLLPAQLNTKYVPSAEILLTGSLPSGQDPAKLKAEKKDRIKSRNSFFINKLYITLNYSYDMFP